MSEMKVRYKKVSMSDDERETFLEKNDKPETADEARGYIWHAVYSAAHGDVYLFADEMVIAAEMADAAGLHLLAERIRKA
jgi:hypothetical protein